MNGKEGSDARYLIENTRYRTWYKNGSWAKCSTNIWGNRRLRLVVNMISNAATLSQIYDDASRYGWSVSVDEADVLKPVWDTPENMRLVDIRRQAIMQKYACKKSACDPNQNYCKCVKNKRICTILCIGCKNITQHNISHNQQHPHRTTKVTVLHWVNHHLNRDWVWMNLIWDRYLHSILRVMILTESGCFEIGALIYSFPIFST